MPTRSCLWTDLYNIKTFIISINFVLTFIYYDLINLIKLLDAICKILSLIHCLINIFWIINITLIHRFILLGWLVLLIFFNFVALILLNLFIIISGKRIIFTNKNIIIALNNIIISCNFIVVSGNFIVISFYFTIIACYFLIMTFNLVIIANYL